MYAIGPTMQVCGRMAHIPSGQDNRPPLPYKIAAEVVLDMHADDLVE